MNNYKITNLRNNKSYFMNSKETANFFSKNSIKNYSVIDLDKIARLKHNKRMDVLAVFCTFLAFIIATLIYIQTNY